ncbi:hypothetical protein HZA42_04715 [Candidatus Peregrinibacteria bacterium]|nr:hypothetical protein [Candidatus Peregrinibacteria bacterium]
MEMDLLKLFFILLTAMLLIIAWANKAKSVKAVFYRKLVIRVTLFILIVELIYVDQTRWNSLQKELANTQNLYYSEGTGLLAEGGKVIYLNFLLPNKNDLYGIRLVTSKECKDKLAGSSGIPGGFFNWPSLWYSSVYINEPNPNGEPKPLAVYAMINDSVFHEIFTSGEGAAVKLKNQDGTVEVVSASSYGPDSERNVYLVRYTPTKRPTASSCDTQAEMMRGNY